MKSAFMIKEAKLPAGFPPPGKVGQVMVKRYPAYRAARVQSERVANGGLNEMFGPLFNHIKRRGIEMTSPVEITYALGPVEDGEAKPAQMAFLYGTPETGEAGSDGIVEVLDVGEMTVASVAVRGSYNSRTYRLGMEQLRRWLDENRGRYEADGRPRFLGYNSPFVPWFMKLGEVQVPVRAVGDLAGF